VTQPNDRTAGQRIQSESASDAEKKALASALAGSAVGPIFPKYFALLTVTGLIGVTTAIAWHHRGRVQRWRTWIVLAALVITIIGWPLSGWVSQLRIERFADVNAKALFGPVHLLSLGLSAIGTILSGVGVILVGWIPKDETPM
jgi:acyl phosphate:glycerol-3-phosphate acyltransferase